METFPKPHSDPDPGPLLDAHPNPDPGPLSDAHPDPDPGPLSDALSDAHPDAHPDARPDARPDLHSGALAGPLAGALAGAGPEPRSHATPPRGTPSAEMLALLAVHRATVAAPGLGRALAERLGGGEGVLAAPRRLIAALPGVTPRIAAALASPGALEGAREEMRWAEAEGIALLVAGAPGYPAALLELPGMPLVLYCKASGGGAGEGPAAGLLDAPSVAVVGSRRPSPYGRRQAGRFARGLALRGLGVTSGLARGIDAAAHEAALDAGGWTLAVLGSGLDRIYPPEHAALARRIVDGGRGALITEHPRGAAPRSHHFPLRNRILSGLSAAVLVVEAGARSGSLITVSHALEQGRAVYAVPGRVDQAEATGSLELLRDGALLALGPEDILPGAVQPLPRRPLPSQQEEGDAPASVAAADEEAMLLDGPLGGAVRALFEEADLWHADALAERAGVDTETLLRELARWELEGRIARNPGGAWEML